MFKILVGGAAAAAIITGGAAIAQAAQPASPAPHLRHGHSARPMTRAEVQARTAAMFARLDTNRDGSITRDELSASEAQRQQKAEQRAASFDPSKMFDKLDANHDGQITTAELDAAHPRRAAAAAGGQSRPSRFARLFARADANKDGVITRAEFEAMGQQMKARLQHASLARGGVAERMFDRADANKDGRVSLAEMQQAALARFDRMDLNHDGTITPDERQQARQLFRPKHAAKAASQQ